MHIKGLQRTSTMGQKKDLRIPSQDFKTIGDKSVDYERVLTKNKRIIFNAIVLCVFHFLWS
jgi:hypothetical protein